MHCDCVFAEDSRVGASVPASTQWSSGWTVSDFTPVKTLCPCHINKESCRECWWCWFWALSWKKSLQASLEMLTVYEKKTSWQGHDSFSHYFFMKMVEFEVVEFQHKVLWRIFENSYVLNSAVNRLLHKGNQTNNPACPSNPACV